MNIFKYLLTFFSYSLVYLLSAQTSTSIRSDIPGQAIVPYAVGKHNFQSQTSLDLYSVVGNDGNSRSFVISPNTLLKYGIIECAEINLGVAYNYDRHHTVDTTYHVSGLSAFYLGTRINICEGNGAKPAVGVQATFKLPVLSTPYNPEYVAMRIKLSANGQLSEKCSYVLNIGADWNGSGGKAMGLYVANLGYTLSPKWSTYIENYGNFNNDIFENRWDTGLAYLLNDDLQLDVYGGMGIHEGYYDYFISGGVSWRIRMN